MREPEDRQTEDRLSGLLSGMPLWVPFARTVARNFSAIASSLCFPCSSVPSSSSSNSSVDSVCTSSIHSMGTADWRLTQDTAGSLSVAGLRSEAWVCTGVSTGAVTSVLGRAWAWLSVSVWV